MAGPENILRDVLWKMYQEHCNEGRHHETQRSTVTNLVIVVAAGVIGLITYDKGITWADLPLTCFLILLGLFGAVFTLKHYERFAMHMARARSYRDALDELLPKVDALLARTSNAIAKYGDESAMFLKALKRDADAKHEIDFPKMANRKVTQFWLKFILKRRLHQLWLTLHLFIAGLGIVLSIIAAF